ncbi:MAG: hypothetical protein Q4F79_13185 [Eubacteriales bacterium]|nr:hypothetical protein [Eubacteriales bacterium]
MWTTEQEAAAVALIEREMQTGIKNHGLFVDAHQGWAVILEEIEEAQEQMEYMIVAVDAMKKAVQQDNDDIAYDLAHSIFTYAKKAMLESMQAAAMAEKYMESFKEQEGD